MKRALQLTQIGPSIISGIHNTALRPQYGMQSESNQNKFLYSVGLGDSQALLFSTVQTLIKLWPRLHKDTRICRYGESRDDTYFSQ
jgi:hypothetical protein